MRRIAGVLLGVVGLILGILGIASMGGSGESEVKLTVPSGDTTFVNTAPGVLNMVAKDATITLTAKGETINWALGTEADVKAWVGGSSSRQVTGMSDWDTATWTDKAASEAGAESDKKNIEAGTFGMLGFDMWSKAGEGKDSVTVDFTAVDNQPRVLLATTKTGKAPELTIAWDHNPVTKSTFPLLGVGILLLLVGAFMLLQDSMTRKASGTRRSDNERKRAERVARETSETSILPKFSGDLAAPETPRDIQQVRTGNALGAGILPPAARAEEYRNRELNPADRLVLPEPVKAPEVDPAIAEAERAKRAEATGSAMGAGILPASTRAEEFRSAPLADEDRVILKVVDDEPEAEPEVQDAPAESDVETPAEAPAVEAEPAQDEQAQAEEADAAPAESVEEHATEPAPTDAEQAETTPAPAESAPVETTWRRRRRADIRREETGKLQAIKAPIAVPEAEQAQSSDESEWIEPSWPSRVNAEAKPAEVAETTQAEADQADAAPADAEPTQKSESGWRSLWNFDWGTPNDKKDGGQNA